MKLSISALTAWTLMTNPDYVVPLSQSVATRKVDRGVAIWGSGVGACVCANKVKGARACLIHDHFSAKQGVEDDHMSILCMGGRTVGPEVAWDLVEVFLTAEFSQAERHLRRLGKVASLETQMTSGAIHTTIPFNQRLRSVVALQALPGNTGRYVAISYNSDWPGGSIRMGSRDRAAGDRDE
jgi:ribose 5-phosphate isomerase B